MNFTRVLLFTLAVTVGLPISAVQNRQKFGTTYYNEGKAANVRAKLEAKVAQLQDDGLTMPQQQFDNLSTEILDLAKKYWPSNPPYSRLCQGQVNEMKYKRGPAQRRGDDNLPPPAPKKPKKKKTDDSTTPTPKPKDPEVPVPPTPNPNPNPPVPEQPQPAPNNNGGSWMDYIGSVGDAIAGNARNIVIGGFGLGVAGVIYNLLDQENPPSPQQQEPLKPDVVVPVEPVVPVVPVEPEPKPTIPSEPKPVEPAKPVDPVVPVIPVEPPTPVKPTIPSEPKPVEPAKPSEPTTVVTPTIPTTPTTTTVVVPVEPAVRQAQIRIIAHDDETPLLYDRAVVALSSALNDGIDESDPQGPTVHLELTHTIDRTFINREPLRIIMDALETIHLNHPEYSNDIIQDDSDANVTVWRNVFPRFDGREAELLPIAQFLNLPLFVRLLTPEQQDPIDDPRPIDINDDQQEPIIATDTSLDALLIALRRYRGEMGRVMEGVTPFLDAASPFSNNTGDRTAAANAQRSIRDLGNTCFENTYYRLCTLIQGVQGIMQQVDNNHRDGIADPRTQTVQLIHNEAVGLLRLLTAQANSVMHQLVNYVGSFGINDDLERHEARKLIHNISKKIKVLNGLLLSQSFGHFLTAKEKAQFARSLNQISDLIRYQK